MISLQVPRVDLKREDGASSGVDVPPTKASWGGTQGFWRKLWRGFVVGILHPETLRAHFSPFQWHLSMLRIFSSLKIIVTNKRKLFLKQYMGFDPFFDCSYFSFHSIPLELPPQSLAFDLIDPCQSQHKTDLK